MDNNVLPKATLPYTLYGIISVIAETITLLLSLFLFLLYIHFGDDSPLRWFVKLAQFHL